MDDFMFGLNTLLGCYLSIHVHAVIVNIVNKDG